MSEVISQDQLQVLLDDYYNHRIDMPTYRAKRKEILDALDAELNGNIKKEAGMLTPAEGAGNNNVIGKMVSFFKAKNTTD